MRRSPSGRRRLSLFIMLVVGGSWLCLGCGSQKYELRLEETKKYFAYLQRVNNALADRWDESGFGVVIRIPLEFEEIPPPPPPAVDEDGNPVPVTSEPDPRQPAFSRRKLPGMIGAWEWVLPYESEEEAAEGSDEEAEADANAPRCYIYALGNHQMWIDRQEDGDIDPAEFFDIADNDIAEGFRLPRPSEDQPWDWQAERIPSKGNYRPPQDFEFVEFEDQEINNAPTEVSIYHHEVGDIQVVLLILVPSEAEGVGNLAQSIRFMLEWLDVEDRIPSRSRLSGAELPM